ncbi:S-adenosyl-l-methionine hydroxide adenosyltransferase family protein [Gemmatimonadota bacterium]
MGRVITLTTDFGTCDGYVGAIKGVLLSIAPDVRLVDISHDIGPGRIRQASFLLENILDHFPERTIHLVVVDPTVGSQRRALIVDCEKFLLVGPDNGAFEPVFRRELPWKCHEITDRRFMLPSVSGSFHGRDIFAPAAAHLANGVAPDEFGSEVENPVRQSGGRGKLIGKNRIVGNVVHTDRFGNLITDITPADLEVLDADHSQLTVSICGKVMKGISTHYAQARRGKLLALTGGTGFLEVAANLESAAALLGSPAADAEVIVSKRVK